MSRFLFTLSLLLWSTFSFTQKKYFQQHVNYTIDVKLDDHSHILRGFEKIVYTNHSEDTLKILYFHLWPNAFKNDRTSYAEQGVENGFTDFYFSKEDDRGFIDSLDFKINNEAVVTSHFNNHEDIIVIDLNTPLAPNSSIDITTPFRLVIPKCFSRLGHSDQSYQISQWYPKPAVYDNKGWHPIPYLDIGEFYSEYGDYNVSITLPSNYVVASTGDLQEVSEKEFLETRIQDTSKHKIDTTTGISLVMKTITYKQSNVHDFAWLADKDFRTEKTILTLPSGKTVECVSYFKPYNAQLYNGSSKIISETIDYLSKHVGEYPYSHASIADASLLAGDGMEYPNIAVIGKMSSRSSLQTTIIHEIGHNWFYGLLGSNEREHTWMDEGINSYYENVIDEELKNKKENNKANITKGFPRSMIAALDPSFLYQLNAKNHTDQPIELPATDFTYLNYAGIAYQKTAAMFRYLNAYIGDSLFDIMMKRYYSEWHFKHPYPEDFKKIATAICNPENGTQGKYLAKNIDWFFEDGLNSDKKIDFAIQSVNHKLPNIIDDLPSHSTNVFVKSKTSFKGPIPVSACKGDETLETVWVEYPYLMPASFVNSVSSKATNFTIDRDEIVPEIKTANNFYKTKSLFHRFTPAVKFGGGIGIFKKQTLYLLPAIGYNYYDKFTPGIILHNIELPNKKFQFGVVPKYSIPTKSLVGAGFVSYTSYPKNSIQQITFGAHGKTYHNDESNLNISASKYTRYYKLMPFVDIDFKKSTLRSPISNNLLLKYYFIGNQQFNYTLNTSDSLYQASVGDTKNTSLASIALTHTNARTFNPYSYKISAIGNTNFLKTSLEANLQIDYFKKGKAFYTRFYAGKFFDLKNDADIFSLRNQYLNTTYNAANDYMYDDVFLARSERDGLLSHQVSMKEGGFKIQSLQLSNPIGLNYNWLMAFNFRTDLPFSLPMKVQLFLDAGTYANAAKLNTSGNKVIYDGGVEAHFFNDFLVVYLPLMMCKDFKDFTKSAYPKNRLLNSMSFALNLDKVKWYRTQKVVDLLVK